MPWWAHCVLIGAGLALLGLAFDMSEDEHPWWPLPMGAAVALITAGLFGP